MDGVPSIEVDMGVPSFAKNIRGGASNAGSTFCYIGELSRERDTHRMITSFLRHATSDDRFLLVGPCETKIAAKFAPRSNLVFTGRVSQERALEYVASSDIAVCFVPNRRPYQVQTPTKLLEYAALGKPIIANACPSILRTANRYGIRVLAAEDDLFAAIAAGAVVQDNHDFDAARVTWPAVLEQANIRTAINTALAEAS